MADDKLSLTIVVNDCQMQLRVAIGDRYILLPYEEAERLRRTVENLIPYQYGQLVYVRHEFDGVVKTYEPK